MLDRREHNSVIATFHEGKPFEQWTSLERQRLQELGLHEGGLRVFKFVNDRKGEFLSTNRCKFGCERTEWQSANETLEPHSSYISTEVFDPGLHSHPFTELPAALEHIRGSKLYIRDGVRSILLLLQMNPQHFLELQQEQIMSPGYGREYIKASRYLVLDLIDVRRQESTNLLETLSGRFSSGKQPSVEVVWQLGATANSWNDVVRILS